MHNEIKSSKAKARARLKRSHGRYSDSDYQPIGKDNTSHQEIVEFNERTNRK